MPYKETLHVGRPNLGDREDLLARIGQALDRRWLSNNGPLVQEFERQIANTLRVEYAVAMCNATVALQVASKALGLRGEVIMPSYTFVATAHAMEWIGITPVFCDIRSETHNIDPEKVANLVTSRTTGIIGVHLWGRPCDTEALEAIGSKHGLETLYDASHAFDCSHRGTPIGNFGRCEVFSFHATKFIHSAEGSVVTTNDPELAEKMRLMRNFGFSGFDSVSCLGINAKMSEISAAVGLATLEAKSGIAATNKRNHAAYLGRLSSLPGITLLDYPEAESNNRQYVVAEIDPCLCPRNRDEILSALHAENVIARRYFWPGCHRMEPYRTKHYGACNNLPSTELVASRVIVLPTGQSVSLAEVARVCDIIERAISRGENGQCP